MKLITTSWDDGHPLDFKLADLLCKYNLKGTFYIPQSNAEHEVMTETEIVELANHVEIGGHTLHHKRINNTSKDFFEKEIAGCHQWLSQLLQSEPEAFCFPGGVYNQPAIEFALQTGFKLLRTTELLNADDAIRNVMPTTIQVFDHSTLTYTKHLLKRGKLSSLALYLKIGAFRRLEKTVENYIEYTLKNGGCFHLWGHSWEIEEYSLWADLERILKLLSGIKEAAYVTNAELLTVNN